MSRLIRTVALFGLTLLLLFACHGNSPPTLERPPLKIAYNLWPGYFPITLAQAKGFFTEQGVAVETVYTEDQQPQIADFYAGKYDGLALPLGGIISVSGNNPDIYVVFVIDESVGADAVVARPEIKTIADLKGETIGAVLGGFGELFIEQMLKQGNLTRADVTLTNTDSNYVPDLLKQSEIQAGHAWEPYVSRAVKDGNRVLFTSTQTPGLILDVITFRGSVVRDRPEDVRAFIRACLQASDYWQGHFEEGNAMIAKALKINAREISLKGIKLLTLKDNFKAFNPKNPNSLYQNAQLYTDFYVRTGGLGRRPDLKKLIDPSFLTENGQIF